MAITRKVVKVRLVTDGEPDAEMISVPLRGDAAVVSAIKRSLPKLRRGMRKRWPALRDVQIRPQAPRLRNPVDASHYKSAHYSMNWALDVRWVLAAFFGHAGGQIAKDILRPPAKEIGEYLRRWVRRFTKPKPRTRANCQRAKR